MRDAHLRRTGPLVVGGLLVVSWLTLPIVLAHALLGLAFTVAAATHAWPRRHRLRALARTAAVSTRPRAARRQVRLDTWLIVAVAVMTVSGVIQWIGVWHGPATGAHAASSFAVFVLAGWHAWIHRQQLRRRRAHRSQRFLDMFADC